MRPRATLLALALAFVVSACAGGDAHDHDSHDHGDEAGFDHHGNPLSEELFYQDVTIDGIRLEFTIQTFLGVGGRGGHVVSDVAAGSHASAVVHLTDAVSGEPITGVTPLAWIGSRTEDACVTDVGGYLGGSVARSAVVDLSDFFVLALNEDPGISVIDPSVDVAGMTQLFAVIPLVAPGVDWAFGPDGRYAAVAIPSTGQVAVIDLESFEPMAHLAIGGAPDRVAIDPATGYAWVLGSERGATVVDLAGFSTAFEVDVDGSIAALAFSGDRVLVVDGAGFGRFVEGSTGRVVADGDLGGDLRAVVGGDGGFFIAVGSDLARVASDGSEMWRVEAPGVTGLWIDESLGILVAGTAGGGVVLLSTDSAEILSGVDAGGVVTDVAFAFGEIVVLVPARGELLRIDPARLGVAPTVVALGANGVGNEMAVSEERGAILVAVPGEDRVTMIPAGSTAPAGSFQGHGLVPRSVGVVDRSLTEVTPGVFTGKFRAPEPGEYQLAVLVDEPRIVQCFDFAVAAPDVEVGADIPDIVVGDVEGEMAGAPTTVGLSVSGDPDHDVEILIIATTGAWQERVQTETLGGGEYRFSVTLPAPGLYQAFVRVVDLGFDFGQLDSFYLDAG